MARYIKKDEFIAQIQDNFCTECNNYDGIKCKSCGIDDTMEMVENAPDADVVPKSEVESIENRCKELEQIAEYQQNLSVKRYFEIKRLKEDVERLQDINENQVENIRLAKSEVAREIFEEIEKIATAEGAYDYVSIQDIAELKKKYTE